MQREPNTIYTLSLSYGKDSLACLGAIEKLGLPLDRIVHAEVWATETIPADLPPMVEFKTKADKIIKERYGIEVEHVWATKKVADGGGKLSYDSVFRRECETKYGKHIYGFPCQIKQWCTSQLKQNVLTETNLRRYFLSNAQTSWGGTRLYGYPIKQGQWCNNLLKVNAIDYGIRKPLGAVLHRRTQTSGDTDFRGISKWEEVNGVRVSNETQSRKSFLQALARRAI